MDASTSDIAVPPDDAEALSRPASPRDTWFIVAVWAAIGVLALLSPANLVIIGWFTDAYSDAAAASEVSHRLHEVAFGIFFSLALVGVASQLTPRRNPAGLLQAIITLLTLEVMVWLTLEPDFGALVWLVPVAAVAVLHGSFRPIREARFQVWALALVVLVTPAQVVEISGHIAKAQNAAQNHTSHWTAMAAFSVVMLLLGLVVASGLRGFRLVASSLAGAAILYGTATVAFPYDASSHRTAYGLALIVWGVGWGLGARFASRGSTERTRRPFLKLGIVALLAPVTMIAAVVFVELDKPPNVPHRPDPANPEVLASGVDRETCLGCHASAVDGATVPPHEFSQACDEGDCWGGRTDCAGCHRIDPALGGPTEVLHALMPTSTARGTGPPTGGQSLDSSSMALLTALER